MKEWVFGSTFDALFNRVLAGRLTPECQSQLKSAGLDVLAPLSEAYDRKIYFRGLQIVSAHLYPQKPIGEAMYDLGLRFWEGFGKTPRGEPLLTAIKRDGPMRSLFRSAEMFKASNNYMRTQLNLTNASRVELWLSQSSGFPEYFRGVIFSTLVESGAAQPGVEIIEDDGQSCNFRINWAVTAV